MTEQTVWLSDSTGDELAELIDLEVDEVEWNLNGIHTAKIGFDPLVFTTDVVHQKELKVQLGPVIEQFVPRQVDGPLSRLVLSCESLLSWFDWAYITDASRVYNGIDQLTIAWDLIQYAQSLTFQDRNVDAAAFAPSGVLRDRTYDLNEFPCIYDLLTAFPDLQNGFDFDIAIQADGSRLWTPYYPQKGTRKPEYTLELDQLGRRFIVDLKFKKTGLQQATDFFVTGSTDQNAQTKTYGRWTADNATLTKYSRIQRIMSEGNVPSLAWLNATAEKRGREVQEPVVLPEIIVESSLLGLVVVGDTLPIDIDWGAIQIQGDYRIKSIRWDRSTDTLSYGIKVA